MASVPFEYSKSSIINLGFAAIILLMIAAIFVGYKGAEVLDSYYKQQRVLDHKTRLVYQMREAVRKRSFSLSRTVGLEDYFDRDEELQHSKQAARDFITARDQILAFGISSEEQESISKVTRTIGEVQPFMEQVIQYALEEGAQGKDLDILLPRAFAEQARVLAALEELVATQERLRRETQNDIEQARKNTYGNILVILFGIVLVAIVIAVIVAKREHRLVSALTAAKEDADQANRAKSTFLATMSHELRTPLNAIIGFSDMIKSQVLGPAQPEQYEYYAKDIYGSGQHLLSLINEILDMSKIEAGEFSVSNETFELGEVIKDAMTYISFSAEEQEITLITEMPEALPLVTADSRLTKQILINLLTNAIKFTPDGGKIEVRVSASANTCKVDVIDNGIGMSPEDAKRALEPFVQIERENQRNHQGTGLGIPLCKNFVELQGGEFALQSAVGSGTTASFTVPISHEALSASPQKQTESHSQTSRWLPSMSVGVTIWDNDHRDLLETIERLKQSVRQNVSPKELECVCEDLSQYVDNHLASEERVMREMGYPHFIRHKSKHAKFRAWLAEQREQRKQSPESWDGELVVEFLQHWWHTHILKEDMAYKEFMEAHKTALDERLADQRKVS